MADLIGVLIRQFGEITDERVLELNGLASVIRKQQSKVDAASLTFICTHNSRRSQLAELWMRIATQYYGHPEIACFSGGTEATAFNHRMVTALETCGFKMIKKEDGKNPAYQGKLDHYGNGQLMFSKKFDDPFNPATDFIAVMVCSHADQNCPMVSGATQRISLPYLDPKAFDNTDQESQAYQDKVMEIGREMLYVASKL